MILRQVLRQRIQQFRVRRRVAYPHVIHRLDDSAPEKLRPNNIGEMPREPRIIR